MKQINPDIAKLQIDLKQAVAELDRHMRHGKCDERAYNLSHRVHDYAYALVNAIGAEQVRKPHMQMASAVESEITAA